ncbi:MAG: hypothetical protein KF729_22450 [Sandaracinaceae bacterium]|nr:hypothetical protein [Sandaracinaceae bacterium]
MRVLVTGFAPFLEHAVNPSDALARALDGRRAHGVILRAQRPLPVEHGRAARIALGAARRLGADAIVAFGLAAGTPRLRLERVGRNRATSPHPDGRGRVAIGPLVPGAPAVRAATLPLAPLAAALRAAGVEVEPSDDAGGYVCNDLYYRLLHAGARALFVHLPADVEVWRLAAPMADGIARAVVASASR